MRFMCASSWPLRGRATAPRNFLMSTPFAITLFASILGIFFRVAFEKRKHLVAGFGDKNVVFEVRGERSYYATASCQRVTSTTACLLRASSTMASSFAAT